MQACPAWPAPVFAGSSIEEKAAAQGPSLGSGGHAGPQVPHLESVLLARFPGKPQGSSCACLSSRVGAGIPTQALLLARISPVPIYLPLFIKYM